MTIPAHLFVSETDGALYDTRTPGWHTRAPLRACYRKSMREIHNAAQFKAALRNGAYAWPGGYPMYFVCSDGAALSFASARENAREIIAALATPERQNGWRVVALDINYEDSELCCEHSGERIESAYGDSNV